MFFNIVEHFVLSKIIVSAAQGLKYNKWHFFSTAGYFIKDLVLLFFFKSFLLFLSLFVANIIFCPLFNISVYAVMTRYWYKAEAQIWWQTLIEHFVCFRKNLTTPTWFGYRHGSSEYGAGKRHRYQWVIHAGFGHRRCKVIILIINNKNTAVYLWLMRCNAQTWMWKADT